MKRIDCMLLCGLAAIALQTSEVSACAPGFDPLYNGICRRPSEDLLTYAEGKSQCAVQGGLPAIILSKEDNDAMMSLMGSVEKNKDRSDGYDNMWIGLSCDAANGRFVWEDGTIVNYTNFAGDYVCSEDTEDDKYTLCLRTGTWKTWKINDFETLCQHSRLTNYPCDWDMDLVSGSSGDACIAIHAEATSWLDAEKKCTKAYAHLTSIHDETVNSFIRRSAMAQHLTNEIHIGASVVPNGPIGWKDGTTMDYSNFYKGFPDVADFGNCVAMQVASPFNGKWINIDCGASMAYACGRPAFNFSSPVASGCPGAEPFRAGQPIYSPGFPSKGAPIFCDDYVLIASKGKRIELTVVLFESNMCCDTLTLFDGLVDTSPMESLRGSYLAGTTFTSRSNSMRMTWDARNGVNIRGFHLEMREV